MRIIKRRYEIQRKYSNTMWATIEQHKTANANQLIVHTRNMKNGEQYRLVDIETGKVVYSSEEEYVNRQQGIT